MIVVDASVLVTGLADDTADGDSARQRLRGERIAAPHLIDVEVVSAWRRMVSAGTLDERRAQLAMDDLLALRMQRVSHLRLIQRCWQLCANLTAYDAAYVALAERLGATLVTADVRLTNAPGPRCQIEVLTA